MFDVFYLDRPTKLFNFEKKASSIEEAKSISRTRYLWILDGHNDYSSFDWTWEPLPWENNQAHVWPSQHQENGGTWLVPKQGFSDINRNHGCVRRSQPASRLHIKHMPESLDEGDTVTRYVSDYLGTMRRALVKTPWTYCWVTSDVCDYTNFDFTWHPSEWQSEMLHVFASNEQKFGDTFFVHVPTFLEKTKDLKILEWFDTLHFVENISIPRKDIPSISYSQDSIVPAIWEHEFRSPIVQFYKEHPFRDTPTISLWQENTKTVIPLSKSASHVLIPRECKNHIKTQVYDYPYIDKNFISLVTDNPLDIVFISNGEHGTDHHFEHLKQQIEGRGLLNVIHHSKNVKGRVACYQAAAKMSQTDWFFTVFAKLKVNDDFDWSWQPDRMQQPKHYIFHAYNPVNHLVYGHQAMIAYNKKLVLENTGQGLDFTLDQMHEVVPSVSGTAYYDNDSWTCWRTAFREALKLKHSLPDIENEYRLNEWLTRGDGINGKWSMQGAKDAVSYYESVGGDFKELKKSYEWDWLAAYAILLHPQLFTQSKT